MLHMASIQETKSLQDQELTLPDSLQPKFTNIYNFFPIYLFIYVIPSSNFVSFCFFPFQTFHFHFVISNICHYVLKFLWMLVNAKLWPEEGHNKIQNIIN